MKPVTDTLVPSTLAEDIVSSGIQALGTTAGIVGLVVLIIMAVPHGAVSVTSVSIYGGTLVLAYLVSALYHGVRHRPSKRVLQIIDHCTIYLLIAGTYTPFSLLVLDGHAGWALLAIVWSLALAGIVLRTVWPHLLRKIGPSLYLVLGWLGIAWSGPVVDSLGPSGVSLVIAGGVAYSLGVVFYLWDRLPFNQAVWHLFVATGSACFFSAIAFYALSATAV